MIKRIFYQIVVYLNLFLFNIKFNSFFKKRNFKVKKYNTAKEKKINIAYEFPIFFLEHIYFFFLCIFPLRDKVNMTLYYYQKKKNLFIQILKYLFLFNIIKYINKDEIKNSEFLNYNFSNVTNSKKITEKIFKNLKNKKDVFNIKYKNFKIGKYIYQSYCREEYEPVLDYKDHKLKKYILEAIEYTHNSIIFLSRKKYSHMFVTHAGYLKYNCLNLVAKHFGCKISMYSKFNFYKIIRFVDITKKLTQDEYYEDFKKDFNRLKNKKEKINISKKELTSRNLKFSQNERVHKLFINSKLLDLNSSDKNPNKILILPPCMFDTLFHFNNNLFDEPYEWLIFILKRAEKTNFSWYVKPHPDQHSENQKIYDLIRKRFKKIKFLDPQISAQTFKKANFKSMFTYQTTGVHEYIHMGIPSVISGDNIQSAFNFGKPVKTKKHLEKAIQKANKIKLIKNDDIYKFNYMMTFLKASNFKVFNFIKVKKSFIEEYSKLMKKFGKEYSSTSIGIKNIFFNINKINLLDKHITLKDEQNMINVFKKYLFNNRC